MRPLAVVLAAALLVAGGVRAQAPDRFAGGGLGLVQPVGSFGEVERLGWQVFGAATGTLRGPWGFALDAMFGRLGHAADVPGSSRLLGATANLAFWLAGAGARVRPLLYAGGGVYRVNVYVEGFGTATATELAWNGGAGALIGAGGGRRIVVLARYVTVRTQPEATSVVPVSVGLVVPIGFP